MDQGYEQNNKIAKVYRGAIRLLENENALLKWVVASPIISIILELSQEHRNSPIKCRHHEDTK